MSDTSPLRLGIEIGGTKLQLGLGRGDGTILARERRAIVPGHGASGLLTQIVEALGPLLRRVDEAPVDAVGIGFGGPVDVGRGVVTTSHQVEGWDGFPLAEWVRATLHVDRVAVQNDADTAGLAEARFGAGQGVSPVLYITVGSGIGGGLILDGQIYRGSGVGAVEVGHLWVNDRSRPELSIVPLESVASGWAIDSSARAHARALIATGRRNAWPLLARPDVDPDAISARDLADSARAGDQVSAQHLERAVDAMVQGLRQAVTLLAPRRVILGGGVSLIGEDLWLGPIRRRLEDEVFSPFRGTFDLVGAALGEDVVVHGALALARDALGLA